MSEFISIINEKNLCTWYILPLLSLNKSSFVDFNFVDSYMSRDGNAIAVKVVSIDFCSELKNHEHYSQVFIVPSEEKEYIIFNIPSRWRDDVNCYLQGQYSKFSEEAKMLIKLNSGLKYNVDTEWGKKTDAVLLALDKHPALREQWSIELTADSDYEVPENSELLSIPSAESFINLENLTTC